MKLFIFDLWVINDNVTTKLYLLKSIMINQKQLNSLINVQFHKIKFNLTNRIFLNHHQEKCTTKKPIYTSFEKKTSI